MCKAEGKRKERAELVLGDPGMSVDAQLISQMEKLETALERLESQPQRRLLTDYDWLRGWHDDFLGDTLAPQYEQRTEAAARSSLVLQDGAHGGVLRLLTGNVVADYARLNLGITLGVGPYDTDSLNPDNGFLIIARLKLSSTANILTDIFALTDPWWRIHITADTTLGANWFLRTDNNSGVDNNVDSGVAFDTAWHWHVLEARSGYAGHWLDAELINETTTKIPTVALTAGIRSLARANASKYGDFDFWGAIPR